MFSKDDFSYIADNVTACGAIAAIIDYSFMPAVRFGEIIGQIAKALAWLDANINSLGGDRNRLSISGHSAGAHLASFSFMKGTTTPQIKGALLLSGIYDLKPLQSSFLEPLIGIRDDEVEQYSPLHLSHQPSGRVIVAVGEQETASFHEQTSSLVAHLEAQGLQVD
jgi:arylformamidase